MPNETPPLHLTILGDRQTGKTTALIDMAVEEAGRRGGIVWYQAENRSMTKHAVKMAVDRIRELDPSLINRVNNINGRERIIFSSGGLIDFDGAEFWRNHRRINLHCMDEAPGEPYPRAARSARTVLR